LKQKGNKEEFQEWFLNYKPDDLKNKKLKEIEEKANKKKTRRNKTKTQRKKRTKKTNKFAIYGGKTRRRV